MTTQSQEIKTGATNLVPPRGKLKEGMIENGLFLLIGHPKVGKSSLAASAPNSYMLNLERGGADRISGRIHDIADLAQFREILKTLITEPSIKTIAIDSLDVLSDWIEDDIARARGLSSITERKHGVDGFEMWGEFRKRIEAMIAYLKNSKKLVILVAHCKEPKLDSDGNLITPAGINMPGKAGSFIAAQADAIGYVSRKPLGSGSGYFVSFCPGPIGVWGSRLDELNDKTLQLPRENPWSAIESVFKTEPNPLEGKPVTKAQGGAKK